MKFDENGKQIKKKSIVSEKLNEDYIYVDLKSKYVGISDSAVNIVFGMIKKDKIEEMHMILRKIQSYAPKFNTFI